MFLSLSEIEIRLKKLREQRANINATINYYEHLREQAITERYRGMYMNNDELNQRPTVRY